MKPAFLLMCFISGLPSGEVHFKSVVDCNFYKKSLSGQSIKIREEQKYYDCYCKLVIVNEKKIKVY